MNRLKLVFAAAVLTGPAVAFPAIAKVDIISSSSTALGQGSTFAWAPVAAVGYGTPDPAVANEITAERLRLVTESTLASKGYRQVPNPEDANLLVAYTIIMLPEEVAPVTSHPAACGSDGCQGGVKPRRGAGQHTQGYLVLDLVERESGRLVWRATSKKRVTARDASEKKLKSLLRELTKALPLGERPRPSRDRP